MNEFSAKLLIQYAPVGEGGADVAWSSLDKHSIRDELVNISRVKT
jgi:hypothetical protein